MLLLPVLVAALVLLCAAGTPLGRGVSREERAVDDGADSQVLGVTDDGVDPRLGNPLSVDDTQVLSVTDDGAGPRVSAIAARADDGQGASLTVINLPQSTRVRSRFPTHRPTLARIASVLFLPNRRTGGGTPTARPSPTRRRITRRPTRSSVLSVTIPTHSNPARSRPLAVVVATASSLTSKGKTKAKVKSKSKGKGKGKGNSANE